MQRLEVSGAVRPIYGSLGVKRLTSAASLDECSAIVTKNEHHMVKCIKIIVSNIAAQQHWP